MIWEESLEHACSVSTAAVADARGDVQMRTERLRTLRSRAERMLRSCQESNSGSNENREAPQPASSALAKSLKGHRRLQLSVQKSVAAWRDMSSREARARGEVILGFLV
eukprot:scaffold91_cov254-Pinguiococcus_pyrenoidosus.AAC.43